MTELLRFRWTSHGPMLDENGPFVLFVDSEAAIDEARSQEAKVHAATERWSPLSYLQGQRDALADAVQRVEALKPMLWMTKREGGYDCCGCNTLLELYEDCIAAIKGEQP